MTLPNVRALHKQAKALEEQAKKMFKIVHAVEWVEIMNDWGSDCDKLEVLIEYNYDHHCQQICGYKNLATNETKIAEIFNLTSIEEMMFNNLLEKNHYIYTVHKTDPLKNVQLMLGSDFSYFHQWLLEQKLEQKPSPGGTRKI